MAEQKTILIVEDEKPLLHAVKSKLEQNGFATVSSRSVEQALDYLNEVEKVDAIWLDHYLIGKEDGLDLVSKLKSDGAKWRGVPVFLVTNTAGPDKLQTYMRFGVDKYYIKADHRLDEIVDEVKSSIENNDD